MRGGSAGSPAPHVRGIQGEKGVQILGPVAVGTSESTHDNWIRSARSPSTPEGRTQWVMIGCAPRSPRPPPIKGAAWPEKGTMN